MANSHENNKKILLFGKNGQLGSSLNRLLSKRDFVAFDFPEINFLDPEQIKELIKEIKPSLIVNAAAYTAVDKAESNHVPAMQINGATVGVIAEEAKKIGAGLIHYSTDYVFNGRTTSKYKETDPPDPINYYGLSKLRGEENIVAVDGSYLIFRLSWVYSTDFSSFVTKVLKWSRSRETLQVVDDQISKPSWSEMLAENTIEVINQLGEVSTFEKMKPVTGIYHLAGKGEASRFEWAKEILANDPEKEEQVTTTLVPVKTTVFPTPAERPLYSVLDCSKFEETFMLTLPDWKTSLVEAMSGKSE
ncbi:MAG: dTDP-4-dehydrorhamnose reductase [Anaerolineales bacterium]